MKRIFTILLAASAVGAPAQIAISGTEHVEIAPAKSTGLDAVYVLRDCATATLSYTGAGAVPTVERFSRLGGGYAEPQPATETSGTTVSWKPDVDGMGYIITDGSSRRCIWITNYATTPYTIDGLSIGESDCDRITLILDGAAAPMRYFTVNGQSVEIDREIALSYTTQEYFESDNAYRTVRREMQLPHAEGPVHAPAPLCETQFTIAPGRFASLWQTAAEVSSPTASPTATDAHTSAEQASRDADNETGASTDNLGGSAPCEITFSAAASDACEFHRWEVAADPDFVDVDLIFDGFEFTHTFTDAGSTFVRFVADNAAGTCQWLSETYTVAIGQSRLECPNAFSPANQDGVNDEWKVSYSSIVSFHCEIFNRWGKRLATLTDPSQSWDGKAGGKIVGPGVYFYVIKATGADGIRYDLSGDINVIGVKNNASATSEPID